MRFTYVGSKPIIQNDTNFICCDSPICTYCANYQTPNEWSQSMCDHCCGYDQFIGVECVLTMEDE
jgi:hypothetical protein